MNIDNFFIEVVLIAWISVIWSVTLGLAQVSPEPDLTLPSLWIGRDIKLS